MTSSHRGSSCRLCLQMIYLDRRQLFQNEADRVLPRRILSSVVAIAVIAVVAGLWIVRGSGPVDFADGPKVALADYHGANPTGVRRRLRKRALSSAALIWRGRQTAR